MEGVGGTNFSALKRRVNGVTWDVTRSIAPSFDYGCSENSKLPELNKALQNTETTVKNDNLTCV